MKDNKDALLLALAPYLVKLPPIVTALIGALIDIAGDTLWALAVNATPLTWRTVLSALAVSTATYFGIAPLRKQLQANNGQQLPMQEPVSTSVQAELDKG